MSHDFAKGPKKKKRPTATPKPTPKKAKPKGEKQPILLWLVAILASVGLLAGLVVLSKVAPTKTSTASKAETQQTQFEFFTLLPENEIEIDVPISDTQEIVFEYFLQAGSFKHSSDAESRRAELAFLGYESYVTEVIHDGKKWHRVQIGPIPTRSQLAGVRGALLENGFETLVIKREVQ